MENSIEVLLPWKGVAPLVWLVLFFTAERLRPAAREAATPAAAPAPAPRRLDMPIGVEARAEPAARRVS